MEYTNGVALACYLSQLEIWHATIFLYQNTKTHVQVIVEARGPGNEEGSANTDQVDVGLEVVLQRGLAEAESLLKLELVGKDRTVSAVLEDVLGGKSAKGIGAVEGGGHLC